MPEPRVVIAAGTDACSGGIWNGPEVLGGVEQVLPVDVYIPGDPPSPIALLHGAAARQRPRPGGRRAHERRRRRRRERARGPDDHRLRRTRAGQRSWRRRAAAVTRGAPGWRRRVRRLAAAGIARRVRRALSSGSRSTWFAFGRAGVHVDNLAGLFLILAGLVSARLFVAADGQRRAARAPALRPAAGPVRGRRIRRRQRVRVPDRLRADVVAIYALISVRYRRPAGHAGRIVDADARQARRRRRHGRNGAARGQGRRLFVRASGVGRPAARRRGAQRCFALLFVGFAVKAALIPLQTWLPGAYAGADADSSGLIAAVSLNVAFYAMLRVWFGFLGHPAVWWAVVALLVARSRR